MNKRTMAFAGTAIAAGLSLASAPAFAAIDFSSATWAVGGVLYQFEDNDVNTYGGIELPTTESQSNAAFSYEEPYWGGYEFDPSQYAYCQGDTANAETQSNGDVVITCDAYEVDDNIWVTNSYRLYDDHALERHVMTVENRGEVDVAMDNSNTFVLYLYLDDYAKTAASNDPLSCTSMDANDNWALIAGTSDTTIAGMAWQAKGQTAFSADGEDCTTDDIYVMATRTSIAAGESVNYMSFITTTAPAGPSTGEMDTAFDAGITAMGQFDSLNDTLCRGLDGVELEGWGLCSLAETGTNSAQLNSTLALGGGLAAVGLTAIVVRRRRTVRP